MTTRRRQGDDWSPYGHEKARRRLLVERQGWIVIGAVGVALLYALFLQLTLTVEETTDSAGTIDIERDEMKPVTVTVTPGRAPAFMDAQSTAPAGTEPPRPEAPQRPFLIRTVGPFLPLVAPLLGALWLLSRAGASARGKLAELNLGVYKGAMPYEMHTCKAYSRVFTHREVKRHVFGKQASDFLAGTYLHRPPVAVRRLLGDTALPENAEITRLERGRAGPHRAPVPARPTWKDAVVPQPATVRRLRPPVDAQPPGVKGTLQRALYSVLDLADRVIDRIADWLEPLARRMAR